MAGHFTISLEALRFFAYHGLHEGERKTGNEFEVTLHVTFESGEHVITSIDQTVNYASLSEIVNRKMDQPENLLETIAMNIVEEIHTSFPRVRKADVSITKLHPPIPAFTGHTVVRYEKEFAVR
jgi:dihydroneopterin aldolase